MTPFNYLCQKNMMNTLESRTCFNFYQKPSLFSMNRQSPVIQKLIGSYKGDDGELGG